MANTNAPFGLAPVMNLNGSSWNQQVRRYYVPQADANRYNLGDLVLSAAGSDANGVPQVVKATVGTETVRGVVVGVENPATGGVSLVGSSLPLEQIYAPATKTKDYYLFVVDDPDVVFMAQGDLTGTNQIAANANKNASMTITNPSGNVPTSASVINSGSIAVTAGLNIKLMGLAQIPNNAFGAFAVWYCKINQHEFQGNTAGV